MTAVVKHAKLIGLLLRKSRGGQLAWKETADENAFQVSFPKNSVQISASPDGIEVSVINADGKIVEAFSDREFQRLLGDLGDEDPFLFARNGEMSGLGVSEFDAMSELFQLARRVALGADKALDDVLSELAG